MEDGEKLKLPGTWGLGGVYLRRKDSGLALPIMGKMCQRHILWLVFQSR